MQACFVAEDKYIYAIGGCKLNSPSTVAVPQCSRFDTNENKFQDIANLQEARQQSFGVAMSTHEGKKLLERS